MDTNVITINALKYQNKCTYEILSHQFGGEGGGGGIVSETGNAGNSKGSNQRALEIPARGTRARIPGVRFGDSFIARLFH